jgi:hypothetical protein
MGGVAGHAVVLGGQGIEQLPSLRRLLELWLEDCLAEGGRRRTSDAVAGSLGKASGVAVVEVNGEESRGEVGAEGEGELFGGALLLKLHEAVAEGRGNGGWERRRKRQAKPWADKAAATAIRTHSVWPMRLYSDRGTDGWAPRGFDFFLVYPKPVQL